MCTALFVNPVTTRCEALMDASADAVLVFDERGRVIDASARAAALFQRSPEALFGRLATSLLSLSSRWTTVVAHRREVTEFEVLATRADGSWVPLEMRVRALETEDRLEFTATLRTPPADEARDLPPARDAEAERMEALGRVAAGVGADFDQTLQALVHQLEGLLEQPAPAPVHAQLREVMRLAQDASHHPRLLLSLVQPSEHEQVEDVGALVQELAELVRGRGVDVLVLRPVGPPLRAALHPQRLRRVVLNLLVNAHEALGGVGTITLRISPGGGRIARRHFTLSVEDRGVGIAKERLPRLFEAGFTTKTDGEGLGLTICKDLVERAEGRIDVQSQLGHGTAVTVALPLADAPA